jgi:hypothetical protein
MLVRCNFLGMEAVSISCPPSVVDSSIIARAGIQHQGRFIAGEGLDYFTKTRCVHYPALCMAFLAPGDPDPEVEVF